jgi:uncharacterized damage-inducible protein DinB
MRGEIVQFLDDTFGRRNWGHAGLLAAIRGLGVDEARWKPRPASHSVWQQINHVIYWKRHILRRVQGEHVRANQAWPPAGRTGSELKQTRFQLVELHDALRRAVLALPQGALEEKTGGRYSLAQLLLGSAAHESYHTGQILFTRKLYRRRGHTL